ncbi:type II secretion system protein XpsN [Lysobacter tyrosinilyticus]
MRFDSAGPRTWLLAATATWALLALLLALFGMGGHVSTLPEDLALLKALPVLPKAPPERLGLLTQYSEIANRPVFADDRRPHAFSLQPQGEEQVKAFDYVLTSVIITPTFKMAIIQPPDNRSPPLRIKLGEHDDSLPNWTLQSIEPRTAVFIGPEGERKLELRVYNGVGGEAPTAVTKTDAQPAGQTVPAQPGMTGPDVPATQGPAVVASPTPAPPAPAPPASNQPMTEQAQMEAIRKRIEARRAQLRQEALLQQQQQKQKPPVK